MTARYKTFAEFMRGIKVAYRVFGGCTIVYTAGKKKMLQRYNVLPWNSKETKRTFLARMYVNKILSQFEIANKIRRPEKYDLLGRRCKYHGDKCVIVNAVQVVDTSTGEVDEQLTLFCLDNKFRHSPFKILKSQL